MLNHAQPLFGPERTWKLISGMFAIEVQFVGSILTSVFHLCCQTSNFDEVGIVTNGRALFCHVSFGFAILARKRAKPNHRLCSRQ